jgi:hypothetical protein
MCLNHISLFTDKGQMDLLFLNPSVETDKASVAPSLFKKQQQEKYQCVHDKKAALPALLFI